MGPKVISTITEPPSQFSPLHLVPSPVQTVLEVPQVLPAPLLRFPGEAWLVLHPLLDATSQHQLLPQLGYWVAQERALNLSLKQPCPDESRNQSITVLTELLKPEQYPVKQECNTQSPQLLPRTTVVLLVPQLPRHS